jgi:hypothetical protein
MNLMNILVIILLIIVILMLTGHPVHVGMVKP